ncbi:MAG: RNA recognition motif domain-containing protein [Nitrospiraceae bacterium]
MKTELLLDGLPRALMPQDVTDLCSPYGTVLSVQLHFSPGTRSGFAYVKMATEQEARAVRQALNHIELKGELLLVIGP